MEMRSDICVARLSITVDPQDGSYMPSKVRLSVGDSFERIKEYKTLNVQLRGSEAGEMILLQDIREVSDLSVSVNSAIVSVLIVSDGTCTSYGIKLSGFSLLGFNISILFVSFSYLVIVAGLLQLFCGNQVFSSV